MTRTTSTPNLIEEEIIRSISDGLSLRGRFSMVFIIGISLKIPKYQIVGNRPFIYACMYIQIFELNFLPKRAEIVEFLYEFDKSIYSVIP